MKEVDPNIFKYVVVLDDDDNNNKKNSNNLTIAANVPPEI